MTSNAEEMVTISRAEYEALKNDLQEARCQLDCLMEQLRLMKKDKFGASSEKMPESQYEQLSLLCDEAECYTDPEYPEFAVEVEASAHRRKVRSGELKECMPDNVPVDIVEHRLSGEELNCPICGTQMQEIGKEIRRTLEIIPQQVRIREDWYYTYACGRCKKDGTEVPVAKAPKDQSVIPGSHASPEAIAHIMTQKFVMGSPIYRQEQELNRSGVMLSRQTMSNWILKATELWLQPLYDELHQRLLEHDVLHADETTLEVLRPEKGKDPKKAYMWLYRTGGDAAEPIVLYDFRPDRKAENAVNFLESFSGWLHADGYQGYHRLPENIRVVGCWAHARRKFVEALAALPEEDRKGSTAEEGVAFFTKLFAKEKQLQGLSPEEKAVMRLKEEKPILDALLAWATTKTAAPKSALGKALHYLTEQWPYLMRYLEDGRLELTNNRAERSIKPFVIDRKNFLFANTERGAQGSAVMFSIIETAKENGLDPYRYLVYIFRTAPNLDRSAADWVTPLFPANAPPECKSVR